jgi:hypothetical protein
MVRQAATSYWKRTKAQEWNHILVCRLDRLKTIQMVVPPHNYGAGQTLRSEGPGVNSHVHEGGEYHPLNNPPVRRTGTNRGAPSALRQLIFVATPPSRTELLTSGPSDLKHAGD